MSESINVIMKSLRKNNYEHMGFNIYNETKLPRWNAYVKLEKTGKDLLNQFDEQRQTQIKNSVDLCVNIKEDPNKSLEELNLHPVFVILIDFKKDGVFDSSKLIERKPTPKEEKKDSKRAGRENSSEA